MASQNWTEWNVTLEQVEEQMREEVRRAADKYLDQYLGLVRKTISSYPLVGGELGEKAKDLAEKKRSPCSRLRPQTKPGKGFP